MKGRTDGVHQNKTVALWARMTGMGFGLSGCCGGDTDRCGKCISYQVGRCDG